MIAVKIRAMPTVDALRDICGRLDCGDLDYVQFLELFTRELAREMACSRAGIWIFVGGEGARVLHNLAMYDAQQDCMVAAEPIEGPGVAAYFDALLHDGCVVASDAMRHPATVGLRAELERLNVRSLLDVCFSGNGSLFGSFSCEQIGRRVEWTPRQLQRLRQIGAAASLTLVRSVHWQVDTAHGDLWETSTPNRLLTMPMPLDPDPKK